MATIAGGGYVATVTEGSTLAVAAYDADDVDDGLATHAITCTTPLTAAVLRSRTVACTLPYGATLELQLGPT